MKRQLSGQEAVECIERCGLTIRRTCRWAVSVTAFAGSVKFAFARTAPDTWRKLAKTLGGSLGYGGRTQFRTLPGRLVFFCALSFIVLAISLAASISQTETWILAVCWTIYLLSIVAIADLVFSDVHLDNNELRMRYNFRTRIILRENIESVSVAKGCPIILILKDGGHVSLPDLAVQGIGNSLRAWIRAT